MESTGYFVLLRVLAADADRGFPGFRAGFVQFVYPLAAGGLEEVATWDDEGLFRLSEFDLDTETFSDAYVFRACLRKDQIDVEVTVFDFRDDFGDPERELPALPGDGGGQAGGDPVDVVFAEGSMDLELVEDFDLGDRFGALYLLSGSYLDKTELAGKSSANNQVLHALLGAFELFTLPFKIVFHQLPAQDRGRAIMAQTF